MFQIFCIICLIYGPFWDSNDIEIKKPKDVYDVSTNALQTHNFLIKIGKKDLDLLTKNHIEYKKLYETDDYIVISMQGYPPQDIYNAAKYVFEDIPQKIKKNLV